jgi:hypothetical protein
MTSILRRDTFIDPGDPSRHAAVLVAAAFDRSLAHRAELNIRSVDEQKPS